MQPQVNRAQLSADLFPTGPEVPAAGDQDGISQVLAELGRRKIWLGVSVAIGIVAGGLFGLLLPKQYTATAWLLVQPRDFTAPELSLMRAPAITSATVRSEAEVVRSPEIIGRVADRLRLGTALLAALEAARPDLAPANDRGTASNKATPAGGDSKISGAASPASVLSRASDEPPHLLTTAIDRNLDVQYNHLDYLIRVSYTDPEPSAAAHIANTIVETYLEDRTDREGEVSDAMIQALAERVDDLRERVERAETDVESFRLEHNLARTTEGSVVEQQLAELNEELGLAQAALTSSRAIHRAAAAANPTTIDEVVNSPAILLLREREAELAQEIARLDENLGPRHPRRLELRRELSSMRESIDREIERIHTKLAEDIARARQRVAALEQQIETLQSRVAIEASIYSRLGRLEREAASARNVYEAFLARLEQAKSASAPVAAVELISSAVPPVKPSGLSAVLMASAGGGAGLLIGVFLVLIQHYRDGGFDSLNDLFRDIGIRGLGILPYDPENLGDLRRVHTLIANEPDSPIAESIRGFRVQTLGAAAVAAPSGGRTKVILVTSALPNEGKSTFSLALAATAATDGYRALLIECDLRQPSFSLMLDDKEDAASFETDSPWAAIIHLTEAAGLDVLPAYPCHQPQKHLRPDHFNRLLSGLAGSYDLIVLDTPPVMDVADATLLSGLADATILLVTHGKTRRSVVRETVRRVRGVQGRIDGVVLSKAKRIRASEYYRGYTRRKGGVKRLLPPASSSSQS